MSCKWKNALFEVFLALLLANIWTCSADVKNHGFSGIDRERYELGKRQYEIMETKASLPKFGVCWTEAIKNLQQGCKELSDVVQSHLALAYLNCFLTVQGRKTYTCPWETPIAECTQHMSDVDQGSFTTFFTYTHNICYFLEAQTWHESTEKTIDNLSTSSKEVVARLEESKTVQDDILKQQNQSLFYQLNILNTAENLETIIQSSKENINEVFLELQKTTKEQRSLINSVFDRVSELQTMMIGEYSWLHSLLYYAISVLVAYLLTSTKRTSGARIYLFGVMTFGLFMEKILSAFGSNTNIFPDNSAPSKLEESIYYMHWNMRKFCGILGFVVLAVCAYRFQDIEKINNKLLQEILNKLEGLGQTGNVSAVASTSQNINQSPLRIEANPMVTQTVAADTTGYESDSAVSGCSSSSLSTSFTTGTDITFTPAQRVFEGSETESSISRITESSLMSELEYLREHSEEAKVSKAKLISSWAKTGHFRHSTPIKQSDESKNRASKSSTPELGSISTRKIYNLRSRSGMKSLNNPLVQTETPSDFARLICISEKNSMQKQKGGKY